MQRAILGAIVLVAALARFWGLRFGLPHTFARPDETIIIDVSLQFLRGNFRPAFYDYPWLYMWLVAGLYLLYYVWGRTAGMFQSLADVLASWKVNWTPFFLLPRGFSAVVGALTVWPVYRIGARLWDRTTALVAALFIALAFLHVRDSHYATTDITMTFFLVLSISFLIDGHLTKRTRDFVLGGLMGGLAAATKYNAVLLIAPLVATYLLNIFEQPPSRRKQALFDPRLFIYGVPFLLTLSIGVPFLATDLPKFVDQMRLLDQSMKIGGRGLELGLGWIHHLEYSLRYGLGIPLMAAGIAGIFLMLARETRVGILLLSFPIVYYVVAGSLQNLFFRYAIPLVPFLCLTAARAVTLGASWAYDRFRGSDPVTKSVTVSDPILPGRSLAVAIVALAVVLPSAINVFRFDRIMSRTDNRVVVARWFDDNVPHGSSVLLSGSFYGYIQFTRSMEYQAWVWDRGRHIFLNDLTKRPAVGSPDWILVQESPLPNETQPRVFELLAEGYTRVKDFPAFSPSASLVYDQQDAFFAPFAGFGAVERPGPNYALYKRNSAP